MKWLSKHALICKVHLGLAELQDFTNFATLPTFLALRVCEIILGTEVDK